MNRETQKLKSATANKNIEVCNLKHEIGISEYNILFMKSETCETVHTKLTNQNPGIQHTSNPKPETGKAEYNSGSQKPEMRSPKYETPNPKSAI